MCLITGTNEIGAAVSSVTVTTIATETETVSLIALILTQAQIH